MGYILVKLLSKIASEAQNLSREVFSHEIVTRQSRKFLSEFCVFMFCLNLFWQEELSRELLAKMPLKKFFFEENMKNAI